MCTLFCVFGHLGEEYINMYSKNIRQESCFIQQGYLLNYYTSGNIWVGDQDILEQGSSIPTSLSSNVPAINNLDGKRGYRHSIIKKEEKDTKPDYH